MNVITTLANNEFLQMENALNQNVCDVFTYLIFMAEKSDAEDAQYNFMKKQNNGKRKS
jgi:hypothetical protein